MYKTSHLKLYWHNDELDVRNILGSLIGAPLSRTKVKPYIYTSGRGYYHQNKSNEKTRWFGNSSCREFCDWAVLKYGYGSTIGSARVCRWKGAILESIAKSNPSTRTKTVFIWQPSVHRRKFLNFTFKRAGYFMTEGSLSPSYTL